MKLKSAAGTRGSQSPHNAGPRLVSQLTGLYELYSHTTTCLQPYHTHISVHLDTHLFWSILQNIYWAIMSNQSCPHPARRGATCWCWMEVCVLLHTDQSLQSPGRILSGWGRRSSTWSSPAARPGRGRGSTRGTAGTRWPRPRSSRTWARVGSGSRVAVTPHSPAPLAAELVHDVLPDGVRVRHQPQLRLPLQWRGMKACLLGYTDSLITTNFPSLYLNFASSHSPALYLYLSSITFSY